MKTPSPLEGGVLYVVATPIGNLEDITQRALRVLREADVLFAEDTRVARKLLQHYGVSGKPLFSCHAHNEQEKAGDILRMLREKKRVALVSDSGMPGVSDPGVRVVRAVLEEGFSVTPVPGPSAPLAALAAGGLSTSRFLFAGFLPAKAADRRKELVRLRSIEATLIFFEAPHRLRESLKDMMNIFGERKGVVAREITKKFEEFQRGSLKELWQHFKKNAPKGECTVLVEGAESRLERPAEQWVGVSIADQLRQFLQEGLSKTQAVKEVCRLRDLPREVVYKIAMELSAPSLGDSPREKPPRCTEDT